MSYREDDYDQHVADDLLVGNLLESDLQMEPADDASVYHLFGEYLSQADAAKTPAQSTYAMLQCLHAVHYLLREKEARGECIEVEGAGQGQKPRSDDPGMAVKTNGCTGENAKP